MNNIKKFNIPKCIAENIAVYKFVYLVSSFKKKNSDQVQVFMTKSAKMSTSNCVNS